MYKLLTTFSGIILDPSTGFHCDRRGSFCVILLRGIETALKKIAFLEKKKKKVLQIARIHIETHHQNRRGAS